MSRDYRVAVDDDIIWDVVKNKLPVLRRQVSMILD